MDERRARGSILFVLSDYGVGGAEKQLANLIANRPASARNVAVQTITFLAPTSPHVASSFESAGAINTLIDRSSMSFPVFLWRLIATIRRVRPVLVCTILNSSVGAWGRLAALVAGVPLIAHSDRQLEDEGTRAHLMLRPHLDRRTDLFLPNAHAIAQKLKARGVAADRIEVVPNGVNTRIFEKGLTSGMRSELGIGDGEVVLGFLGRFASVKRLDVLVTALNRLPEGLRPDRVLLAGDGPCMGSVRQDILHTPWLADRTHLLGSIDSTPEFLAAIDYLVLSSDSEGLPNVVLESMSMSKPVVSTRVSDVPLLIGDTGFLAEPGDPDSLASAIAEMQSTGHTGRKVLGERARQRIEEGYSMEVAAQKFWSALLTLVSSRSMPKGPRS